MIYSQDKTVLRVFSYKKCDNRKSENGIVMHLKDEKG